VINRREGSPLTYIAIPNDDGKWGGSAGTGKSALHNHHSKDLIG
jgi:hypothetical protein